VLTPPKLMLVLKGPVQVVLVGLAPPSDPPLATGVQVCAAAGDRPASTAARVVAITANETLDSSQGRSSCNRPKPCGSSWHVTAGEYLSFSVLQARQSNATPITRPLPALHFISVSDRR